MRLAIHSSQRLFQSLMALLPALQKCGLLTKKTVSLVSKE